MVDYYITYRTENSYENPVFEAFWQYLITPETNESQVLRSVELHTSLPCDIFYSKNGYGFEAIKLHCKKTFQFMQLEVRFHLEKRSISPQFQMEFKSGCEYERLNDLLFKIDFEAFLYPTALTVLPVSFQEFFTLDATKTLVENLRGLMAWVHGYLKFKTGVTSTESDLNQVLQQRMGVCQDFTHFFCALCRANKIPARYVSGYLHQWTNIQGNAQMHAWAEVYVPELGWLGCDPANNVFVNHNYIKVSHGRDYADCAPVKGVFYAYGKSETKYNVDVSSQQ